MDFPLETGPGPGYPRKTGLCGGQEIQTKLEPLCMMELPFGAVLGGPGQGPGNLACVPHNLAGTDLRRACDA